jgi:kinesin family protein 6/9
VQRFLEDKDSETSTLSVGADMRKINYCFKLLKEMYNQLLKSGSSSSSKPNTNTNTNLNQQQPNITIVDSSLYDTKEMKDLKDTLKQRDNEINILVNMLKKEKKKLTESSANRSNDDNDYNNESTITSNFKPPKTRQICKYYYKKYKFSKLKYILKK